MIKCKLGCEEEVERERERWSSDWVKESESPHDPLHIPLQIFSPFDLKTYTQTHFMYSQISLVHFRGFRPQFKETEESPSWKQMRGWLLDRTRGTSSFGFAMILIVGSVFFSDPFRFSLEFVVFDFFACVLGFGSECKLSVWCVFSSIF